MALFTPKDIVEITSATPFLAVENTVMNTVSIHSKNITNAADTLFVALDNIAIKFVSEVVGFGVKNLLLTTFQNQLKNCNQFVVKDAKKAMQQLAIYYRKKYFNDLISITGSNGKTIVKEWLSEILSSKFSVSKSPRSYNSQIGVPLSIFQINLASDFAIIEAGISQKNEMVFLEEIIKPTIGILTNIGTAHDAGFENRIEKLQEKLLLFKDAKKLIVALNEDWINQEIIKFSQQYPDVEIVSWSFKNTAKIHVQYQVMNGKTVIEIEHEKIEIPFTDLASITNMIHCLVCIKSLGITLDIFTEKIKQLKAVEMRLQLLQGENCDIVNDSYSADLDSLNIALDFLKLQNQYPQKCVILSDFFQSGKEPKILYAEILQLLKNHQIREVITIGETIGKYLNSENITIHKYENIQEFFKNFEISFFNNKVVLIKGARSFEFEKIAILLAKQSHYTELEVNLNHLVENVNFYKKKLQKDTKIMCMLKANGYGSGTYQIANVLAKIAIDYLAVAYVDEGIELRKKGIKLPIMVMNTDENQFDLMLIHQLEPEIYNWKMLESLATYSNQMTDDYFSFHLEFDTGMHRLGFEQNEVENIIELIKKHPKIKLKSVFSHLSASDDITLKNISENQFEKFDFIKKTFKQNGFDNLLFHILNSSGITHFPEQQHEMVRLGIGMFGLENDTENMQNVFTLRTVISQIRTVKENEYVSYGAKGNANMERKIAVVAIGYADGFYRKLGNGIGKMYIKGKEVTIVGNICMDMCMLDITGVDCEVGDEVIVFDSLKNIQEMAKNADTIPYEIITSISQRVKRKFLKD